MLKYNSLHRKALECIPLTHKMGRRSCCFTMLVQGHDVFISNVLEIPLEKAVVSSASELLQIHFCICPNLQYKHYVWVNHSKAESRSSDKYNDRRFSSGNFRIWIYIVLHIYRDYYRTSKHKFKGLFSIHLYRDGCNKVQC